MRYLTHADAEVLRRAEIILADHRQYLACHHLAEAKTAIALKGTAPAKIPQWEGWPGELLLDKQRGSE